MIRALKGMTVSYDLWRDFFDRGNVIQISKAATSEERYEILGCGFHEVNIPLRVFQKQSGNDLGM
jgi:hypothetical protein